MRLGALQLHLFSPRLRAQLEQLRPALARAAQQVVDGWEQDEEGMDCELGAGGPCDRVAAAMGNVLAQAGVDSTDGGQDGDDHAWLIAYDNSAAFGVDIPPRVYETGGGYSWRKIQGARIGPENVSIWAIDRRDLGLDGLRLR